jgi:hypothetical protein
MRGNENNKAVVSAKEKRASRKECNAREKERE